MPLSLEHVLNQVICGDAGEVLKQLPNESIDCVVTSPPYWSLRDYGVAGQIGLEQSFQEYITKLCDIFDEVKRLLKPTGTCWINLGDTYLTRHDKKGEWGQHLRSKSSSEISQANNFKRPDTALPGKCLLQIPARFAIEMIDRGWVLRNEIIWHKPNCMPESVKDRFTVDFEKIFFFAKSRKYYFEQQFEEPRNRARLTHRLLKPGSKKKRAYGDDRVAAINPRTAEASRLRMLEKGRNKRSVWSIALRPFMEKHFAVYPQQLVEAPIRAGCPEQGIVLDPFIGSGTTALVARRFGRNFIGIDLNPEYVRMARQALSISPRRQPPLPFPTG